MSGTLFEKKIANDYEYYQGNELELRSIMVKVKISDFDTEGIRIQVASGVVGCPGI